MFYEQQIFNDHVVVMGTTGIKDAHTASLYELAFTATRSVSCQCCEVKQRRAQLVGGLVTHAFELGRLGSSCMDNSDSVRKKEGVV